MDETGFSNIQFASLTFAWRDCNKRKFLPNHFSYWVTQNENIFNTYASVLHDFTLDSEMQYQYYNKLYETISKIMTKGTETRLWC
jgi:hypothetical protein